jgi:hypothetical protein
MRLTCAVEMVEKQLNVEIDWHNIIHSDVARDYVDLKFYMEKENE